MKKEKNVDLSIKDKDNIRKFAKIFYQALFELDDDTLIYHYHELLKELEKRGILCSKL